MGLVKKKLDFASELAMGKPNSQGNTHILLQTKF
jgi:hypothetical protein